MSTMAGIGTSPSDLREGEVEPVYMLTRRRSSIPPGPAPSPSVPPEESVVRVARRREADGSIESWTALETAETVSAPRDAAGLARAAERRAAVEDDQAFYDDGDVAEDEASDIRFIRRATLRSRIIRVFGTLAVLGTLGGGAYVLQQPNVRREALSFVTLGHEETAARFGRQIAALVARVRGR
jgi:hypothetical protein